MLQVSTSFIAHLKQWYFFLSFVTCVWPCFLLLLSPEAYSRLPTTFTAGIALSLGASPPCAPLHSYLPSDQGEHQEVSTSASWKHPCEILTDLQSLPIPLMLREGSSILQVLNSDQHLKAWGKPVPKQQQLLSVQWATGLQCPHLVPSSEIGDRNKVVALRTWLCISYNGQRNTRMKFSMRSIRLPFINENFITHAASAFGIPERLSYLGFIILITYIHKVKPIAKMGNTVNNERNISLRSKTPDQVLKRIIWTLTVVSLCTVFPSKHSTSNLYKRGYIIDKSKFKIFYLLKEVLSFSFCGSKLLMA